MTLLLPVRMLVSASCVLMCASALQLGCASDEPATPAPELGAGDVDDPSTRPMGPDMVGEGFETADDAAQKAAQAKERRTQRDARWQTLTETLRKADAKTLWERAQEQEKSQNWKNAQDAYQGLVVQWPKDANAPKAVELAMQNAFRLGEYGAGLQFFEDALVAFEGDAIVSARLRRVLASTMLAVPHWGTTRGGEYLRNRYEQGRQTQTYAEDRARAIELLEEARTLLASPAAASAPKSERAAVDIDLALAVARFTNFDATWHWWWSPGYGAGGPDDGKADAEGEDENADEYRYRDTSWSGELQRARPRGLPVTPNGDVVFTARPSAYAPGLNDTAKIKFLLHEAQQLDDGPQKEIAGEALLQQALLFRTRDGAEKLDRLRGWWWHGSYPYKDAGKDVELEELGDDEVVALVATGVRRTKLPDDEAVPKLLAEVQRLYPKSKAADEAQSMLGLFHQSREQYPKALAAYEAYAKARPTGAHIGEVNGGIAVIKQSEAAFQAKGPQAAGKPAEITFKHRNLDSVSVKATRIDVEKIARDFEKAWATGPRKRDYYDQRLVDPDGFGWVFVNGQDDMAKPYLTKEVVTFDVKLKRDPKYAYLEETAKTPLDKPGVWLLEALHEKKNVLSRTVVVIERSSIVLKNTAQGPIAWIVDASTGKPIEGAQVEAFLYRSDYRDDRQYRTSRKVTLKTDARGIAMLPKSRDEQSLVSVRAQGAFTVPVQHWLGYQYSGRGYASQEQETAGVIVTDRPVYRPGDTVQLAVWARHKKKGTWEPATNVKEISVRVYDSRGTEVKLHDGKASRFGSTSLSIPLAKGASLGAYRIDMHVDGRWADTGGATFRVEEYKAPEVLVEVKAAGQARLGDKVSAEIVGSYYSGGGVSGAKVSYKVYRQDHEVAYAAPSPWDWLYGRGYGRIWYPYTWFGWWDDYGPRRVFWYPWWGPKPEPAKELVKEGEGRLDSNGALKIEIDTAPAKRDLSDTDHKYTIEAEVTDLSRHLVKGEGEIVVTRTAFIASLELDAGWARAGDDVNMVITTLSPDGSLMAAKGTLQVDEVLGVADNGAVRGEKRVEDRAVSTDTNGPARVKWRAPKTGQYRFTFVAKDKAGNDVKASSVAWVVGPDFTGSSYKFAGVEIVPDKRTYAPGETARLLVSADEAGAAILLATKVDDGFLVDWQVLQLGASEKTRIVELPIAKEHAPNFFVEAVAVGDGQVFSEAREMFVPPQGSELNVKLTVPSGDIKPGASADVIVTTTDGQGKPVSAEVALTVFDSALLAIMPDTMVDVRTHLWGRKRHHAVQTIASLGRQQPSWGNTSPPDQQARWQLASRSQQRFQRAVDFLREDQVAVSGSDALSTTSANTPLGASGSGPGGGGRAKRAASAEGEAEKAKAPAAAPMQAVAADKAEELKKDARDGDDEISDRRKTAGNKGGERGEANAPGFEPTVRTQFADTAFFSPSVVTDANGKAKVTVKFPENLTTWKVKAVGLDGDSRAGRGDASMVTTKNLLIRLAAPRFFREKDEVVLSAIVQNKHKDKKAVDVSLDVTETYLVIQGAKSSRIEVPGHSEARVDFKVKVRGEGAAKVRVTARGSDDGDAKELTFPVLVHGMEKTVARVGSISASSGVKGEKTVEMEVPQQRREEETRLVVRTSPSLAGGMIDALPYLLEYPYGCVEQTLSRFVPAVLTKRALQQSGGITLEQLATQRRNLNPQQLTPGGNVDQERLAREVRAYSRNPIYDSKLLDDIVASGLKRIQKMQHGDGGWGWWADDSSSAYMTAHVLAGLLDARDADLAIDGGMVERGRYALRSLVESEIYRYRAKEHQDWVNDSDAYALWVMSRFGDRHEELERLLYQRRIKLSPYGKLLLAMSAKNNNDMSKAKLLLENVEQFRKEDKENETSWIETSQVGWWYWWNDDIETNALYVRALDSIRPKDAITPGVVKWLLNHRKNGWYWDSTRDTAQVIAAFANHMQVSGERRPDYDLEILVDGVVKKKVHVDSKNMFAVDADLTLTGKEVSGGKHKITVRKTGEGAVYFNTYLSFFTLEDDIKAEGLEVKVERKYWKLERADRKHDVAGDRGQSLTQTEVAYRKVQMKSGAEVKSGDLILVELFVTSKNDYTFLAFEDPKPAGAEAVAVRSGNVHGETWAHMELRDDRVVFFLSELTQGTLKLSYRLRAEIPGSFSAMPTNGFAMYAPEIRANSDELKMRFVE